MTNTTTTVTLYTVEHNGRALRGFLDVDRAEAHAERIDARRGRKVMAVGDRVQVQYCTHPKTGTIVRFEGKRMVVRLVTRVGSAPAEKSFPIEF